jgi:hypothetical protein
MWVGGMHICRYIRYVNICLEIYIPEMEQARTHNSCYNHPEFICQ